MRRLGGSDQHPLHQAALTVCIAAGIMLASIICGCSLWYPPDGPQHVTPEPANDPARMTALLDAPVTLGNVKEPPFALTVNPRWGFYGGAIWVRCFVPASKGARYVKLGIQDVRESTSPGLIQMHEILIERLPCGPLTAVCRLSSGEARTQTVEVKGGPCEGGA